MNFQNICINCMHELNNGQNAGTAICPHCGFDASTYQMAPYVLPPFTVLNGKYLIGKVLGAGGFGITYIAMDMALERVVAIKEYFVQGSMYRSNTQTIDVTIATGSVSQEKIYSINKEKFEAEAKILARLEHLPGIVRVYDYFNENGTSYMALEYLDGMTLQKYVKQNGGKLQVQEVLEKLEPTIKSLELLHQNKILHRDISPDNIMVLKDGSLKLFDFGGVKRDDGREASICLLAKSGYSPIEQMQTSGKQGPWTDVYAMAATLYYCICGCVPVESITRIEKQDNLKKPKELGIELPAKLEAVLMKGMAVKAQDRYQTMAEFWTALEKNSSIQKKNSKKGAAVAAALIVMGVAAAGIIGHEIWKKNQVETVDESTTETTAETTAETTIDTMADTDIQAETQEMQTSDYVVDEQETWTAEASEYETGSVEECETGVSEGVAEVWVEPTVTVATTEVDVQDGVYAIASAMNTTKLLHVSGNSWDDYAVMELWDDNSESIASELFYIEKQENGSYKITSYNSGKVLDAGSEEDKMGTQVIQMPYVGSESQQWYFEVTESGNYYIRNAAGTYLDCEGANADSGTHILNFSKNDGLNQQWKLYYNGCVDVNGMIRPGYYTINSAISASRVLAAENKESGTPVALYTAEDLESQMVYIEQQEEDWYKISFVNSEVCLDVQGASAEPGAVLEVWNFEWSDAQKWYFEPAENGAFYLKSYLGTYVDLYNWETTDGTPISMYEFTGEQNQQWWLMPHNMWVFYENTSEHNT